MRTRERRGDPISQAFGGEAGAPGRQRVARYGAAEHAPTAGAPPCVSAPSCLARGPPCAGEQLPVGRVATNTV